MKRLVIALAALSASAAALAEISIVNGMKVECTDDGVCRMVGPATPEEIALYGGAGEPEEETPCEEEDDDEDEAGESSEPGSGQPSAADANASHIQIINGHKWVCDEEMCRDLGPATPEEVALYGGGEKAAEEKPGTAEEEPAKEDPPRAEESSDAAPRLLVGYQSTDDFLAFLNGADAGESLAGKSFWLVLALVLVGGFLMNLTPCVLPMVPINLMIIGRSAVRGGLYGLGLMLAYGLLGVAASLFGMTFGSIQGNPWFNAAVAVIFVLLGLALSGTFLIDLSAKRSGASALRSRLLPGVFAFFMGVVGAVLAGACVAPILIAVLTQSAVLAADGKMAVAVALPFVLGLGMALPWPLAGAGLRVLPKPGNWMKHVNRLFAVVVFGFAAWYAVLAWRGFLPVPAGLVDCPDCGRAVSARAVSCPGCGCPGDAITESVSEGALAATPGTFESVLEEARAKGKPVFVDCWATWCKNCLEMERTTFRDEKVVEALKGFTVVKLDVTNDPAGVRDIPGFGGVSGYPAFLVFE